MLIKIIDKILPSSYSLPFWTFRILVYLSGPGNIRELRDDNL